MAKWDQRTFDNLKSRAEDLEAQIAEKLVQDVDQIRKQLATGDIVSLPVWPSPYCFRIHYRVSGP